jgi:cellulose synthase/poly-beta-1,6-N-acetylglucosamine synthase-like glycosyltransferase
MLSNYMSYIYTLRKTKSFNKSRYSRNRQYYRTGVFLCLWANIILVIGAYYLFFRLTFKFTYMFIILLTSVALVLFSYFSRNFTAGVLKSTIRLFSYASLNLIIFLNLLVLKLNILTAPHSIVLLRDLLLCVKSRFSIRL